VRDVVESNEVGHTARAVTDLALSSGVVSSGKGGFLMSDPLVGVPTVYHLQTMHRRVQQMPPNAPVRFRVAAFLSAAVDHVPR